MKKFVVVVLIFVSAGSSWAAKQRFPIALTATVQTDAGTTKITDQNLVKIPGDRLVLYVDLNAHLVGIEEWSADLSTQVDRDPTLSGTQSLLENYRMAVIAGKQLNANLEMVDMDWDSDGVPDHDGDLQLTAKLKTDRTSGAVTGISGTLIGVLNDPVNSGNGGADMLFNGKLKTTGPAF